VRGVAAPERFVVHEAGVGYEVRLGDGLSTGIFLDQRAGRRWLFEEAADRRVLNLFCYHAAFTVAAVAGGAQSTVSVDSARPALERARENLDRIGAEPEAHRLLRRDAREYLEGALRRGERFDRIVLDPPSYATTRVRGGKSRVFRAERDYLPLAALCLRLLAPGGKLLACTNHRGIDPDRFARLLRGAAAEAEVAIAGLTPLPDPTDHPPAPGEPCHLKRVVVAL
jgi:23S rRNA (cytosine1962-C5)-methyltransferase